jgi:hypothetical protein
MALKVITPSANTGFDPVGADDYRSGMIGARDGGGNVVVCGSSNDPDSGTKAIGVLGEDRLTSALQTTTQKDELVTITAFAVGIALSKDSLVPNSQKLVNQGPSFVGDLVEGVDYTIVDATGVVTFIDTASTAVGDVVAATYTFKLNDDFEKTFRGVNFKGATDDTEGSKKATVWKGHGEFETDQFVTSNAYAVGEQLRVTKSAHDMGPGLLTNEAAGANVAAGPAADALGVARVTKVPTASDPFLGFEFVPAAA